MSMTPGMSGNSSFDDQGRGAVILQSRINEVLPNESFDQDFSSSNDLDDEAPF
jgi:hypothetical protein